MNRSLLSKSLRLAAAASLALATSTAALATPIIANGGFESGFAGWTIVDQAGGDGTFSIQTGATSPVNGFAVPPPPAGTQAAMTDAVGPGAHVLYQDFLASTGNATLSFDLYIGNELAGLFATPGSLDFALTSQVGANTLNQQARVDIMLATADPFSLAPGDILLNLYATQVGDPLVSGYTTIPTDIGALLSAYEGQTLRLRFAETDNVGPLSMGVDNIAISAVPLPATLALLVAGFGGLLIGRSGRTRRRIAGSAAALTAFLPFVPLESHADTTPLTILDPNLEVATVLNAGLAQPIGIAFLSSENDYLVLEKGSGQVKRVINGVVQATPVLDLAVNSASERGLLSMALHPNFPAVPHVFIYWTESSTGADTNVVLNVPLLGNRVDRFVWNGSALTFDQNIVLLRALQTDNIPVPGHAGSQNANPNGNHNGGAMHFGPDGKLYIFMGDQGRRGWMQNLTNGPFLTAPFSDDTFGGPVPDNAHLSGVILRLNDDGSTPADNPFFAAGAAIGGEAGANIQKVYSYGHRNGFGMAFDPSSGFLWETENADDAYSELNRAIPGMNGGWIQFAGPASREPDWRKIEVTQFGQALQQVRYPPTRAAYTPVAALSRLFMLPGAVYVDPQLSWRYEIGPSGAAFVSGDALGAEYNGTFWMGSARSFQQVGGNGGSLYRIKLTADRLNVDVSADPRLADRVADNLFRAQKFDGTESEALKIGEGFGATPSIEQGPDGNLYVVSLTDNAIYKISRRAP